MADRDTSELTAIDALGTGDLIPVWDNSAATTKKATTAQLAADTGFVDKFAPRPAADGTAGQALKIASLSPLVTEWGAASGSALTYTDHGATSTTEDIAFASGAESHHRLLLDANCTVTFSGSVSGTPAKAIVEVVQDATGSRTITWPAAVKWPNGLAPTLSTAANARDRLEFVTRDGGTTIDGLLIGVGFA